MSQAKWKREMKAVCGVLHLEHESHKSEKEVTYGQFGII